MSNRLKKKIKEYLSAHEKSDGIEFSRAYGDECQRCRSRSIRYAGSSRYCNHCEQLDRLRAENAELRRAIEGA